MLLGFSQFAHAQSSSGFSSTKSIASIFLSLLVVVAIIFALAYVMRRFTVAQSGGGQMSVVASMVAGTKEKILVIEVGNEQHLIGVTSHSITHLSKLSEPLAKKTPHTSSSQGEQFKDKLILAMAGKINPAVKKGEENE